MPIIGRIRALRYKSYQKHEIFDEKAVLRYCSSLRQKT
jgi:hypothetical protein